MANARIEPVFYNGQLSAMQLSVPSRDKPLGVRVLPELWLALNFLNLFIFKSPFQ